MITRIKGGTHRAQDGFLSLVSLSDTHRFNFCFSSNCLYAQIDRENDINKLVGLSLRLLPGIVNGKLVPGHHVDSIRIGWRAEGDKIELCLYEYRNGKRYISEKRVLIDVDKDYRLVLCNDGECVKQPAVLIYEAGEGRKPLAGYFISEHPTKAGIGYLLNPYFGGNNPAPHDMYIEIERI